MPVGRATAILAAATLAAGGYVAADIADLVPGVLTTTRPTPPAPPAGPSAPPPALAALPTPDATAPVLAALDGAAPSARGLAAALTPVLADPALGPSVAVSVRDAATGEELYAAGSATPRVVASTQKVLTAAVVADELDPAAVMTTAVRQGAAGELVLVAGGDTLLAARDGNPAAVAGHGGLDDLVRQVAGALDRRAPGGDPWTLRLDATYAAGPGYPDTPAYPAGWAAADVAAGYTQSVAMLGFADQRPKPGEPSPADPAGEVLNELARRLRAAGIDIRIEDSPSLRARSTPPDARELGAVHSAPYRDVIALALDDSDNALTENLARQAAVHAGRDGGFAGNADFVAQRLRQWGFDLDATTLLDTSGLSRGQHTSVALLSEVTAAGLKGTLPGLADALGRLPVAGLDGTLFDRYLSGESRAAAGLARAKTGTLTGISSLLGTTVDAQDRQLAFVIVADQVPAGTGTLGARAALDRFVATLTRCGCR